MRSAEAIVDLARPESLTELHDHLVRLTAETAEAPEALLRRVGARLRTTDLPDVGLPVRQLVVVRLLAADAVEAAWSVLQDNAAGIVKETFAASTSSGARRVSRRLPLTTKIEPPHVFAWLPGFRDPRYGPPDAAYDITDLVTLRSRLEEMWWDRRTLVLAGTAHLRHIAASEADVVELVCRHPDGVKRSFTGDRRRRSDHVRGVGGDLTRLAWAGWSVRLPTRELAPPGPWRLRLRLTESGLTRAENLGASIGDVVPEDLPGPGGSRARLVSGRLEVTVRPTAATRAIRRVLHPIAGSAPRR